MKQMKKGELSFSQYDEGGIDQFENFAHLRITFNRKIEKTLGFLMIQKKTIFMFADRESERPERQDFAMVYGCRVTNRVVPTEVACQEKIIFG